MASQQLAQQKMSVTHLSPIKYDHSALSVILPLSEKYFHCVHCVDHTGAVEMSRGETKTQVDTESTLSFQQLTSFPPPLVD